MLDKISLFGRGFVGSWVYNTYPQGYINHARGVTESTTSKILWMISTVDNYHVHTNPQIDIETNLVLFMKALENAKNKFGDKLEFNLISTWFVYGVQDKLPVREEYYCNPTGFYSITARAREQLLISYCETFGLKYRILRLGSVMGVGDNKASMKKNAIQHIIHELCLEHEVHIYKQASIRDIIDVRDAARAIHLVVTKGKLNEIYNIGNGVRHVVPSLFRYAAIKLGRIDLIKLMDAPKFHKIVQASDMCLDISKMRSLGYVPEYAIHDTIDWLMDSFKNE